jgi:hypothetical protein
MKDRLSFIPGHTAEEKQMKYAMGRHLLQKVKLIFAWVVLNLVRRENGRKEGRQVTKGSR